MGPKDLLETRGSKDLDPGVELALKVADAGLPYTLPAGSLSEMMPREELNSRRSLYEGRDGTNRRCGVVYGIASITMGQGSTLHIIPSELPHEWPEVAGIFAKLARGEKLDERDELWVREVAEATGWSVDDVIEEFRSLDADPSERVEHYRSLFESYYREALARRKEGDTRQAGEKMWGAVTALVKLYAAAKGVFISHWGLGKLYNFVESNVEAGLRDILAEILDKAYVLHAHFYEGHLDSTAFERRWEEVVRLVEKAREIVFKRLAET